MCGVCCTGAFATGVCGAGANVFAGAMFKRGGRVSVGCGDCVVCGSATGVTTVCAVGCCFAIGAFVCCGMGEAGFEKSILRRRGRISRYKPNNVINVAATNEK